MENTTAPHKRSSQRLPQPPAAPALALLPLARVVTQGAAEGTEGPTRPCHTRGAYPTLKTGFLPSEKEETSKSTRRNSANVVLLVSNVNAVENLPQTHGQTRSSQERSLPRRAVPRTPPAPRPPAGIAARPNRNDPQKILVPRAVHSQERPQLLVSPRLPQHALHCPKHSPRRPSLRPCVTQRRGEQVPPHTHLPAGNRLNRALPEHPRSRRLEAAGWPGTGAAAAETRRPEGAGAPQPTASAVARRSPCRAPPVPPHRGRHRLFPQETARRLRERSPTGTHTRRGKEQRGDARSRGAHRAGLPAPRDRGVALPSHTSRSAGRYCDNSLLCAHPRPKGSAAPLHTQTCAVTPGCCSPRGRELCAAGEVCSAAEIRRERGGTCPKRRL